MIAILLPSYGSDARDTLRTTVATQKTQQMTYVWFGWCAIQNLSDTTLYAYQMLHDKVWIATNSYFFLRVTFVFSMDSKSQYRHHLDHIIFTIRLSFDLICGTVNHDRNIYRSFTCFSLAYDVIHALTFGESDEKFRFLECYECFDCVSAS